MDARLTEIIKNASTTNGITVSGIPFTTISGMKTKFEVNATKLPDFITNYCALAQEDSTNESENEDIPYGLNLAEIVTQQKLPLIINMQLKFDNSRNQEEPTLYDDTFLISVVYCIQNVQLELLNVQPNLMDLICIVMESKPWKSSNSIYVTIRFQFPYCQIDRTYYSKTFRNAINQGLRTSKVIQHLEIQPVGDWDSIIIDYDDIIPMYRSKGLENQPPCDVSHIYGVINTEDLDKSPKEYSLSDIFQPRNHSWIHLHAIQASFLAKDVNLEFWYPLFLSISFWSSITHPKALDNTESVNNSISAVEYEPSVKDDDPKMMCTYLLPLLSINRVNIEPYWLDVGKVLHKIYNGNIEGMKLWINLSAKSNRQDRSEDICTNRWLLFKNIDLSIKTLGWYAREDNIEGYKEWHDAWSRDALIEATSKVDGDVAEALYRVFWLDYICAKCDKNGWYKFDKTYLKPLDDAVDLRRDITNIFIPIYKKYRLFYIEKSSQKNLSEGDKKACESYITLITALIKALGRHSFESTIIKASYKKFHEEDFNQKRDMDPCKTAWLNCVVEICNGQAYTRPGKPEDFITMNTFLAIRQDLHWGHPLVKELMEWLGQVFPDKELLHFFLKDAASFLYGKNAEKLFRIWSGGGDNSKSMINKLFQAVLGMYNIDFPVELLSGKKFNSSGPSPELAQTRGTHVGMICEPESNEEIKSGAVKRYTGGDRIFARALHDNGGSVVATLKMIFMCNLVPRFLCADKATENRVIILPFFSTWSMNAPESIEERYAKRIFLMDPFFDTKIPDLAFAMAWVMIQYYPIYSKEGLKRPKVVVEYTNAYWEENDCLRAFINEFLENAYIEANIIDQNASLSASEIYPKFKQWFNANYPGMIAPILPNFKADMCGDKKLGLQSKQRWWGIRFRQTSINIPNLSD